MNGGTTSNGNGRKALTQEDLERMRLPARYWHACMDRVSDRMLRGQGGATVRDVVRGYCEAIPRQRAEGRGLLLWGPNGTGKSSIAAVIAKEFRRQGATVLFLAVADLKRMVLEKHAFDEEESFWDRAMRVDALILDDLGKGVADSTGFGARLLDELIRARNAARRVTILTTNMDPRTLREEADSRGDDALMMLSTVKTLQEHVVVVEVRGEDQRAGQDAGALQALLG